MNSPSGLKLPVLIATAALLSACHANPAGNSLLTTFCEAPEDGNVRQKFDLRIGFDANGKPDSVTVGGLLATNLTVCRKDKLRWVADRHFEIDFESAENNPIEYQDFARRSVRHGSTGKYHLPARGIKQTAMFREHKYRICAPNCETAGRNIWDPVIIVEN